MNAPRPLWLLGGGDWRRPGAFVPQVRRALAETKLAAPRVAYVGAASGDSRIFYSFIAPFLRRAGAGQTTRVMLARRDADLDLARRQLAAADAVFISGGDVEAGMRWLTQHRLVAFLRALHRRGSVFLGVSAGSIMLGARWVRWRDPNDDATAELFPCLGLAPVVCDTHAEQDGWEELIAAVRLLGPKAVGYGIPSGGALRVTSGGRLSAWDRPAARWRNRAGQLRPGPDLKPL